MGTYLCKQYLALAKTSKLVDQNMDVLWKTKLPLKQRLFLWRCIIGTLSVGVTLVKRKIAMTIAFCLYYHALIETVPHMLWFCLCFRFLIQQISQMLRVHFPNMTFGKHFWLFGICATPLKPYSLFLHWSRFRALWTFWTTNNKAYLQQQFTQSYEFFRASLRQSIYDACKEGDCYRSCLEIVYLCF